MKKYLLNILVLVILYSGYNCVAQPLDLQPVRELIYTSSPDAKQLLVQDTIIYAVRSGGLEELNTNNGSINYHWLNYYSVKKIIADTGSTFIYLKNSNYIGRYNGANKKYENIWPDSLNIFSLSDIDVSMDGKVWAVALYGYHIELFIYDGIKWTNFNYSAPNLYFTEIKAVNDTLVYLLDMKYTQYSFLSFHNGIFDTISTFSASWGYANWDADKAGNIWLAASNYLFHIFNGERTRYDSSNIPIGNDQFLHVRIGSNGHIWTAGNSNKLLEYDGFTWTARSIAVSPIENFTLDKNDYPWVIAGNIDVYSPTTSLVRYNGSAWSTISFPFMPVQNINALGLVEPDYFTTTYCQFATEEGEFLFNTSNFTFYSFTDTSTVPFSNEITCFDVSDPNSSSFGSHHGVYGIAGFDNSVLLNDTINYMYYYNGSYYIGTDSGMVVYNGAIYSFFNMANSPLPSNKITFILVGPDYYYNQPKRLYIGTDKGLAIYRDTKWKVYDTTFIPISNFYVTGVIPYPFHGDSAFYISTMGSGLIEADSSGGYELFNTTNGKFLDDSLFYAANSSICGNYGLVNFIGTSHHGIGYFNDYGGNSFNYDTLDIYNGNSSIHYSKFAAGLWSFFAPEIFIMADNTLYTAYSCVGINEINPHETRLKWHQEGEQLTIFIPEDLNGNGTILLTDVLERTLIEQMSELKPAGRIDLNVAHLSQGVYFLRIIDKTKTAFAKLEIIQN